MRLSRRDQSDYVANPGIAGRFPDRHRWSPRKQDVSGRPSETRVDKGLPYPTPEMHCLKGFPGACPEMPNPQGLPAAAPEMP